jgi:Bacterial archaeo-eukaryotic release factor family 10
MQHVRDLLRKLANFDPGGALVLSVYLDMRPHGDSPAIRPSLIVLADRFRQIEKTLLPRGAALDNFRLDANRVQRFLDEHAGPWLQGVAMFACNSHQLFEVIETGVPFENQVVLEPVPDLFQLARLVDEQETAVVALVDTNTTRLFVTRSGFLEEVAGPDDDPFGYRQRNTGGLNHKQYQRRVQNQREAFTREAVLEELVTQEGAKRMILTGDEVAIPLLHQALSPQFEPLILEERSYAWIFGRHAWIFGRHAMKCCVRLQRSWCSSRSLMRERIASWKRCVSKALARADCKKRAMRLSVGKGRCWRWLRRHRWRSRSAMISCAWPPSLVPKSIWSKEQRTE